MSISFTPLNLNHPELFGVRLAGALGRDGKNFIRRLADGCLARGKTRLILDLSKVVSLGGGGAAALADFQAQLVEQGGEMVFVGNGKVVRKLL
ncbi:MAG: STAS domain-containing protein, partial [bacterium]